MQTVTSKLKATKKWLIICNKQVFGDVHHAVTQVMVDLKQIQDFITNNGASTQLLQSESKVYVRLSHALLRREILEAKVKA